MGVAVCLWNPNFGLPSDLNISGPQIEYIAAGGRVGAPAGNIFRRSTNSLTAHLVRGSVAPLPVVNHTPNDPIVGGIDVACRAERLEPAEPCLSPDDGEAGDLAMAPALPGKSVVGYTLPLSINTSICMYSSSK